MPARSRLLVVCSSAVVAAIVLAFAQRAGSHAAAAPLATGHTFVVNSTVDASDADQADNICASAANGCTLRAAIDQANYQPDLDTIIVPAGTFTLTRVGNEDDNRFGDLDIQQSVTIIGAGPGATIIDGNGAVTFDRVFQIFPSAITTTLSGMTIRNGRNLSDLGGGIAWTGGASLSLSNVRLENNQARYGGGGLFLNYAAQGGSVTLDHLTLLANQTVQPVGAGGDDFGGGMLVYLNGGHADFALRSSQVFGNSAVHGGGISLGSAATDLTALIANTEFYSNAALTGGGIHNAAGDGLHAVQLVDSFLHDNAADSTGGAIENIGSLSLVRTVVDFNRSAIYGGGVWTGKLLRLDQSTVSHNTAQYGGGIYAYTYDNAQNAVRTYLLNSTISSNTASHQGGGSMPRVDFSEISGRTTTPSPPTGSIFRWDRPIPRWAPASGCRPIPGLRPLCSRRPTLSLPIIRRTTRASEPTGMIVSARSFRKATT